MEDTSKERNTPTGWAIRFTKNTIIGLSDTITLENEISVLPFSKVQAGNPYSHYPIDLLGLVTKIDEPQIVKDDAFTFQPPHPFHYEKNKSPSLSYSEITNWRVRLTKGASHIWNCGQISRFVFHPQ